MTPSSEPVNLTQELSTEKLPQTSLEKEHTDVFVDEDDHDIRYKTLSWQVRAHRVPWLCSCELTAGHETTQFVAALMIAEIVSNGMLTLPNAMAAVGAPCSQTPVDVAYTLR